MSDSFDTSSDSDCDWDGDSDDAVITAASPTFGTKSTSVFACREPPSTTSQQQQAKQTTYGLFGSTNTTGGLFGKKTTLGLFGSGASTSTGSRFLNSDTPIGLFDTAFEAQTKGLFGSANTTQGLFGNTTATPAAPAFGNTELPNRLFVFGASSSTASTTAPSGVSALNPSTTSTVTTPPRTSAPAELESISFAQLEEDIEKWSLELKDQEKIFIDEAMQINEVDRLLITNGLMIAEVNEAMQKVKNDQERLEKGTGILLAQQKKLDELADCLEMLKQILIKNRTMSDVINLKREFMYEDAKDLENEVHKMSEDLNELTQHFSEINTDEDSDDPIFQISRLLNDHMASMQWIEDTASQLSTKVDLVKATISSYPGKFETE